MKGQPNFLDELSEKKPDSYKEEVFEPIRRKPVRIIAVLVSIIIIVAAYFIITHLSEVTVPDMSKWQLEDMKTWSSKHHKNTMIKGIYSTAVAQNGFVSQDRKAGTRISNDTLINVTYSLGADPEEFIKLPDIMKMTSSELKTWISGNQLTGVTMKQEESEIIPKNTVINFELVDGTAEEFQRKSRMVIYISNGTIDMDETIEMPDLYGKIRADVLQWSEEQKIKVTIEDIFNQDVEYGKVFEQSIAGKTKITRKDAIAVSISRGKALQVPDFNGMTRSEAQDLSKLLGINVFFKLVNSEETADTVIGQDIAEKSEIDQKQFVTLEVAKEEGKIVLPDFRGLTSSEANSLAALYGIKIFLKDQTEAGENGTVSSQSVKAGTIIEGDQIVTLKLKQSKVSVPDFTGLSQNKAMELAKELNIELIYNNEETMDKKNQTVIGQDKAAGTFISSKASVILTIAVNSGIRAEDFGSVSLKDAKAWAARKGVTLNITECYNSEYAEGDLYDQDCESGDYIPSTKTLSLQYSLGLVYVTDFIGKSKTDIINWRDEVNRKGAGIKLSFYNDDNTTKGKGTITNQSISEETVPLDATIQVGVSSSDNGVIIKNFDKVAIDDFKLWCESNSIPYIITESYSDTVAKGVLYGQNYSDTWLPKNTYLRINYSLGKLYIKDYYNMSKTELAAWQNEVNKKGANIQISFSYVHSMLNAGNIEYQSVKEAEIDLDSKIIVVVSLGPL